VSPAEPLSQSQAEPEFKHPWHFPWVVPVFEASSQPLAAVARWLGVNKEPVVLRRGGRSGRWQRSRAASPGWAAAAGRARAAAAPRCRGPSSTNKGRIHGAGSAPLSAGQPLASGAGAEHPVLRGTTFARRMLPRLPGLIFMERCSAAEKPEQPLGVLQSDPLESISHGQLSSSATWKLTLILPFFLCLKCKSRFLQPFLSEWWWSSVKAISAAALPYPGGYESSDKLTSGTLHLCASFPAVRVRL